MGKLSMALTLLFSTLFFQDKGTIIQPEKIDDKLHANNPSYERFSPEEVAVWYGNLNRKHLITKKINLFFHANGTGSDPNQVQVAQSFVPVNPSWFGMVQAFDYPLTAEYESTSESLGFGQGFFLESSKEEFSAMLGMNLLLTKYYFNSTLTLLGQDPFNNKYRELAVVGGTGMFRLATGTATMFNHYHVAGVAIVELTIMVRYYSDYLV